MDIMDLSCSCLDSVSLATQVLGAGQALAPCPQLPRRQVEVAQAGICSSL